VSLGCFAGYLYLRRDCPRLTLSPLLYSHPGGVEIVTDLAGQDASADYDDVGHTQEAHDILEKFVIGTLQAGAPAPAAAASTPAKEAPKPAPVAAAAPVAPKPAAAPVSKPKQAAPQEDSSMTIIAGVAIAAIAAGLLIYRRSAKA